MEGTLTFISGPMFSGKTEELLLIANRHKIAKSKIMMFKPKRDDRYGEGIISTHDQRSMVGTEVTSLEEVAIHLANVELGFKALPKAIFIDEVQFLSCDYVSVFLDYVLRILGINVYCSGLILDSFRQPFPMSKELLPHATEIRMLTAVCNGCGCFQGIYTLRKSESKEQVHIGGVGDYLVFCAECYANH